MNALTRSAATLVVACLGGAGAFAQTNLRGWHAFGQTWLIWEDTGPTPDTYRIYSSEQTINDLNQASMIGRVFPQDWQAARLKLADQELRWTAPDGGGGRYKLASNEALFVYTPHTPAPQHFAVVKDDSAAVGAENLVGPIQQSVDPVQCHLQASGSEDGYDYRIYAHWIDGRDDWDSGRPDYPVMGNEHFNGTAAVFRVWEPQNGGPPGLAPAVVALHGGGGAFTGMSPISSAAAKFGLALSDGLVIALDDPVLIRQANGVRATKTYWFGCWEGYDRFTLPDQQPVPDDGVIVDYTMRRIDWTVRWIVAEEGIDPSRVSVTGASMGGRGVFYNTRRYPERYSAGAAFVPGLAPYEGDILLGSRSQNLRTSLPGSPTLAEAFHPAIVISDTKRDMVYTRVIAGRNDKTAGAGWSAERVQQYHDLNDAGFGHHLYWDERGHGGWQGAHWDGSPRLQVQSLTRHRSNRSFPAFFNDDQDPAAAGRQPEIGNGDPADGNAWGTWGGYYDWDLDTIEDTPSRWAATVYLVSSSGFANDVPPFDSATADVAIRRPQRFRPAPGSAFEWTFTRLSDSQVMQRGTATVRADGVAAVEELTIYKMPCRLAMGEVRPSPAFTAAGITNAASYSTGAIAPGQIITVFGENLGPADIAALQIEPSGRVSTYVGGVRVLFDGVAAPIVYVRHNQLSVVVPYSVTAGATTRIEIEHNGVRSVPLTVPAVQAAPAIFTIDQTGRGQGAILNQDGNPNSSSNPATPGSVVVVYATGGGQTEPPSADGEVASVARSLRLPVTATIGALPAKVLYAGAAPGLVAGAVQINLEVPRGVPSGDLPVVVTIGDFSSQPGVTVAVARQDAGEPEPGAAVVSPADGLEYSWAPPGEFDMGCTEADAECGEASRPQHRVAVSRGFWLGRAEVTVKAYESFAAATGSPMPAEGLCGEHDVNPNWANEDHPISNVTWYEAQAY